MIYLKNQYLIEHYSRKIDENTEHYYLIDDFDTEVYATDATIQNDTITLFNAKIVDKYDNSAKFKDKINFSVSSINSFNCCPKELYYDIQIECEPEYTILN